MATSSTGDSEDTGVRAGNTDLVAAMEQAGLSNKALAQEVRTLGAERGLTLKCTHTTVKRWRAGVLGYSVPPELIAEALSRRLGRIITTADIGLASAGRLDPKLGLGGPSSPQEVARTAAVLWGDGIDEDGLRLPAIPVESLAAPVLRWLIARPAAPPENVGIGRQVRRADVARVRATSEWYAAVDNQFGGGAARAVVMSYLRSDLLPLLRGTYTAAVGRELFSAAAVATHRTAHLAYDTGRHSLARRYLLLAVDMAHQAADRPLAAKILGTLAHQAIFLGNYREALDILHAAIQGAGTKASPVGRAALHAVEARAYAAIGDARLTSAALKKAEIHYSSGNLTNEPEWLQYFNSAELFDEFGHCFTALGNGREAQRYATAALRSRNFDKYARSTVFTRFVLANAYLDEGEVEQACAVASTAFPALADIRSVRTRTYLEKFQDRLVAFRRVSAVKVFNSRAKTVLAPEDLPG
ncbi:helix-turn-helix domain-containing protein [Streptomyces sp. 110]|uniref:Helix-turn-helix domain-containing protein n=1 Tax=Streptomyces endocoffeicus TaxID=2898945 RepID=A0ABS1PS79_9ACTN|nr:helix-turn-helix domain-containing protein [Streptomyces endocoffeicus]MBL1115292.1 helix-turn-helix domain-containing protein [Streptomyces endocoffeicus]